MTCGDNYKLLIFANYVYNIV